MKRGALLPLALGAFAMILGAPISGFAESMVDVVGSAKSPAERAEACSYAFSDLGGSIRAAHIDPGSMPVSLEHEDLQTSEDLQVTALVFDHLSRQLDVPPARKDAFERIKQAMIETGSHDDERHTQMIDVDQKTIQLCMPIYAELKQRGVITPAEEDVFRRIVRDSTKNQ
ncbi:hypothetical protein [Paraburkholderia sp. 22B1P]|uniref:hypothetical protein n=1 Tax=Paraburkholderia sp. 22B1P TaxID=3080498 RepID=UPI00308E8E4C|nr:hypothetical protein PBP221_82000 [Paraburkholderia sp. 22B1P]